MKQVVTTPRRKRELLCGRFTTANTSTPTSQTGDGVAARVSAGVYTVTLPEKFGAADAIYAAISAGTADLQVGGRSYSYSTGQITITVIDISGAAVADSTGNIIEWIAIMSDRVP